MIVTHEGKSAQPSPAAMLGSFRIIIGDMVWQSKVMVLLYTPNIARQSAPKNNPSHTNFQSTKLELGQLVFYELNSSTIVLAAF